MGHREPKDIDQCIGCGTEVVVYFDSQYLDGDLFCSKCRRIAREARREARHEECRAHLMACAHSWTTSPKGTLYCLHCLDTMTEDVLDKAVRTATAFTGWDDLQAHIARGYVPTLRADVYPGSSDEHSRLRAAVTTLRIGLHARGQAVSPS